MKEFKRIMLLFWSFAVLGSCFNTPPLKPFQVNTRQGPIIGHQAPNRSDVIEYLGIPYAKPPVGRLRFASPQKFDQWEEREAANFSATCPQTPSKPVDYPEKTPQFQTIIANFAAQLGHQQSEDCLTLNVWTKSLNSSKSVLLFFHGGRWTIGEANTLFYHGQYLTDTEDIVVVTAQYRVNIFGFPGTPNGPKNVAFQDQRLAVEWVRDNIRSFGGDPEKIVLSGQSAGSVSVDYWTFSYQEDPIVSGIINHSGNSFSFATNNESLAADHWYNASAILGCGSAGDVLPCMRNKSMEEIKAAAAQVRAPPGTSQARSQPAFQPTIDGISVFTTDEYVRRLKNREYAQIPQLLGNTHFEAGYYRVTAFGSGVILPNADWDTFNLESFTCPASFVADIRSKSGIPIWLYRYFGDWDNLRLYPNSSAYHGVDLHMIFGGGEEVSGIKNSVEEKRTIAYMMRAWASFVRDPKAGLKTVMKWPQFDRDADTLIRLGFNNSHVPSFVSPKLYDTTCSGMNLTWYST